jgi:hypothetical protein
MSLGRRIGACALLAAISLAGAARADDAAPSLASQAGGAIFDVLYSRQTAEATAARISGGFASSWPQAWKALFADAAWEEDLAERPQLQARFSQIFAANFTPQELAAGMDVLRAEAAGRPGQLDPAVAAKVRASAAGRSFMQKFGQVAPQFDDAAQAMQGDWIPGVFRRFGVKAESAAAAPSDAERLQDDVACQLLPADDMRRSMKADLQQGLAPMFSGFPGHPEWQGKLAQAAADEVDASQAKYCMALGPWVGRGLTPEEAQTALDFLKTPSGGALRALLAASLAHKPAPAITPAMQTRVSHFMTSPVGAKLGDNLSHGGELGGQAGVAYATSIVPGVFRRFGEAAGAKP